MLSTPQRTITVTPVVSRSRAEMERITDKAFTEGLSVRWFYWYEEETLGLTSKERLVFLYFAMPYLHDGRKRRTCATWRNVWACSAYLGMEHADVFDTAHSLIERGYLVQTGYHGGAFRAVDTHREGRDKHRMAVPRF